MKNNSKKTNKQNTAHSAQNTTRRMSRRTKDERRNILFSKKHVKMETRRALYGSDHGAAYALARGTDLNRRFVAAFLALVFAISCMVIGVNFTTKAAQPDQVIADGTYTATLSSTIKHSETGNYLMGSYTRSVAPQYTATVTVLNGTFYSINISCNNLTGETDSSAWSSERRANYKWDTAINNGIDCFLNSKTSGYYVNAKNQIQGKSATYNNMNSLVAYIGSNETSLFDPSTWQQFIAMRAALLKAIEKAPAVPADIIDIDDDEEYIPELPESVENSLELDKTINRAANSTDYEVTLEAYSTANLGTQKVVEKVPTDFVIIVDQSGSMDEPDMATKYVAAGNNITIEEIAASQTDSTLPKYYYNDGQNTYRVFADRGYLYDWYAPDELWTGDVLDDAGADLSWFQGETEQSFTSANQYYFKTSDGKYRPVSIAIGGKALAYYVLLYYYNDDGNQVVLSRPDQPVYHNAMGGGRINPSDGWYLPIQAFMAALNWANQESNTGAYTYGELSFVKTGMYIKQELFKRKVGYTRLCYRDNDGVIHALPSDSGLRQTEYSNHNGEAVIESGSSTRMTYSGLLKSTESETRLKSLNTALKDFAKSLQAERDSWGTVDNKVAIVGFSSLGNYYNTELLTGVDIDSSQSMPRYGYSLDGKAHNGVQYSSSLSDNVYKNTLLSATNEHPAIINAINAVTAYGGTQPEFGFIMAKNILENREEQTYLKKSGIAKGTQQPRNQIVIFFTDGEPGDSDTVDRYKEANDVVSAAKGVKDLGATVYSIGVFGSSDGEPLEYPAHSTYSSATNYEWIYEPGYFETKTVSGTNVYLNRRWLGNSYPEEYGTLPSDTVYDYMSTVSSNYPDATKFISDNWANNGADPNYSDWLHMIQDVRDPYDYNPQNQNNYYRMASNQASLISAFRDAITERAEEKSEVIGQVSEATALKDVIDTDNFDVPRDSNNKPIAPVKITFVKGHTETDNPTDDDISYSDVLTLEEFNQQYGTRIEPRWTTDNNGKDVLVVDGFNYNNHYIANGRDGYKMVVKIGGLTPKATATGKSIASNKNTSAMYKDASADAELLKAFPVPTITRHKYDLLVGDDNPEATFLLSTQIVDENNNPVAKDNAALKDVIITNSSGQRLLYSVSSDAGGTSDASAGTGTALYYEQLPEGYKVKTSITTSDNTYTYDLLLDSETEEAKRTLEVGTPTTENLSYDNHTLRISSSPNSRILTLHLDADESPFVDNGYKFAVDVSWTDSEGPHSTPVTMIYNNGTIQDATVSIPYGATNITVSHSDYFYDTSIENGGSTYSISGPFETDQTVSIVDTAKEEIGTGVSENSNPTKILLYGLVTVVVLSAGAGAAYVYRRKDEFLEQ